LAVERIRSVMSWIVFVDSPIPTFNVAVGMAQTWNWYLCSGGAAPGPVYPLLF